MKITNYLVLVSLALAPWMAAGQSQTSPAASTPPAAQAAPAPLSSDQQAAKEQVLKLFEVLRLKKQMQQVLSIMPGLIQQSYQTQMKDLNAKLPPGTRIVPQDQAALEQVLKKYMQEATAVYPVDDMLADAIPVYQRHMSSTDAEAVIAFYRSPVGQRLLDEQPRIMSEYMSIVMAHMQERSKRLTDEMTDEMRQIVKPELNSPGSSSQKPK